MRIPGLSSGMDTEQIIEDIMTAERIPVDRVYQQKVRAEWKRDAYREVNTKLSRLKNLSFDLGLEGTFRRNYATSSRENLISVTATGRAQAGVYELKVNQLATSGRIISVEAGDRFSEFVENLPEDGVSFSFKGLDGELETIHVTEKDTLESVLAKINNNKNLGFRAFHDSGSVSFTTTGTGQEAQIVLSEDESGFFRRVFDISETIIPDDDGYYVLASGKDAEVEVNGITIQRSGNTFDLEGITVNLHDKSDTVVRVDVRHDVDAVVDKIKEFVELYNEIVTEFNLLTREKVYRDFPPLTQQQRNALSDKEIEQWEEKAKSGLLRSDPILDSVLSQMRMALGGNVKGLEGKKGLAEIGIRTGAWYEYGRLHINEEQLRSAIQEDPEGVQAIFTNRSKEESEKGVAVRLTEAIDNGIKRITDTAGKATSAYDESYLGKQIRDFESRIDAMEERLIRIEESHWRKFTAMERALGQLYAQGDWLYQQLMAMQG